MLFLSIFGEAIVLVLGGAIILSTATISCALWHSGDYKESVFAWLITVVLTALIGFLAISGMGLVLTIADSPPPQEYITEYNSIVDRLSANPFDEKALSDAIEYNLKVDAAQQLDKYDLDNKYEAYLNEPRIDINDYQYSYIDERFGVGNIIGEAK